MKNFSLLIAIMALFVGCVDQDPPTNQPIENKLRAVQTTGTSWTYQEKYQYHPDGRISGINWERNTPFTTLGVEKYVYDNNLRLSGIIREMTGLVTEKIRYRYSGSQIAEASSYFNEVKESYTLYHYNQSGQLAKTEFFKRNPSTNEFIADGETRFSYHQHGNIQEIQEFVYDRQQSQMKLHTTRTFQEYLLNKESILDTYPILSKVRLQKNLPLKYVIKTPSTQMEIRFNYRWMPDGTLIDRTATYPDGNAEQTVYTFYP